MCLMENVDNLEQPYLNENRLGGSLPKDGIQVVWNFNKPPALLYTQDLYFHNSDYKNTVSYM